MDTNFFSVLSLLLGAFATYRYSKIWYNENISKVAGLILLSCQAYYLMSNDVRTDGLLTSWVIVSVWLLTEYIYNNHIKYLFFGAFATAVAMMAKGPIALIAVGIAIGIDLLIKKDWRSIFKPQWLLYLLLIGILLIPMCVGLYHQFDLHPEKFVYDLQGPSGLRFYFWTQSFGRITGELYWKNDVSFFYFLHTILWIFNLGFGC